MCSGGANGVRVTSHVTFENKNGVRPRGPDAVSIDVTRTISYSYKPFEQVTRLGLEPKTYGLKVRPSDSPSLDGITTCDERKNVLAFCLAFFDRESPDLANVVRNWSALPEVVRAGIFAMIAASQPKD